MRLRCIPLALVLNAAVAGMPALAEPRDVAARYRCGAQGARLGLPAGIFTVRYLGEGKQSQAVVPVHGKRLVFDIGLSADGSRYVSGRYTWWDAARPSFTVDDDSPHGTVYCKSMD